MLFTDLKTTLHIKELAATCMTLRLFLAYQFSLGSLSAAVNTMLENVLEYALKRRSSNERPFYGGEQRFWHCYL